ncbi:MAG TPA: hypothetical protein V6D20_12570 [Candidatus Obscuribacterales bacterium]
MRLLLVEDEEDLGLAIELVLGSEKYVVDGVPDRTQGCVWKASGRITPSLLWLGCCPACLG